MLLKTTNRKEGRGSYLISLCQEEGGLEQEEVVSERSEKMLEIFKTHLVMKYRKLA